MSQSTTELGHFQMCMQSLSLVFADIPLILPATAHSDQFTSKSQCRRDVLPGRPWHIWQTFYRGCSWKGGRTEEACIFLSPQLREAVIRGRLLLEGRYLLEDLQYLLNRLKELKAATFRCPLDLLYRIHKMAIPTIGLMNTQ